MTDESALLAAILADPDDDAPRLVYADWLDEHAGRMAECGRCKGEGRIRQHWDPASDTMRGGDRCPNCKGTGEATNGHAERAEFIRVQCELARDFPATESFPLTRHQRYDALRRRERDLLDQHWGQWIRGAGLVPDGWKLSTDGDTFHVWRDEPFDDGFRFLFRRGFVDSIRLTTAAFLGGPCGRCGGRGHHGMDPGRVAKPCHHCSGSGRTPGLAKQLFAAHPITAVRLSDRPAHRLGDYFCHTIGTGDIALPEAVWKPLYRGQVPKVWETAEQADAALSASLVRFGWAAAGLPKLEVSR